MAAATMFDKIWNEHVVTTLEDGTDLLHIDRHIMHEMTSFKAFDDLKAANRPVHSPGLTVAVQDHILATTEAICRYRAKQGYTGPLFIGRDKPAPDRAAPAMASAMSSIEAKLPSITRLDATLVSAARAAQ